MLQTLTAHTAGKGITTTIVHGRRPQTPRDVRPLFADGVRLVEVRGWGDRKFPAELEATATAARVFLRELAQHETGVAHLHSTFAGFVGRIAPVPAGWRVFYTPQAYAFLNQSLPWPARAVSYAIEAVLARRGVTLAASRHEGKLASGFASSVAVVQNGVEPPDAPLPSSSAKDRFVIAVLGRAEYQRRPDLVAAVARRLREQLEARFIWIGDGTARSSLEAAGVEVLGWLPRTDALRALAPADVVLHLSAFEGLPLGLLEVMACERAVIASDIPPIREAVGDGGLLTQELEETFAAIRLLYDDPLMRLELARRARRRVVRLFNSTAMAERTFAAYGLDSEPRRREGRG